MAANPYLKSAASYVREAVGDINQQIRAAQADAYKKQRDFRRAIDSLEVDIKGKQARRIAVNDDSEKRQLDQEIQQDQQRVDDMKAELQTVTQQVNDAVQSKTGVANQLAGLAQQLDSITGNPAAN